MHTLKTLTLALLLVIFSVTGLRAEEISLMQFWNEFLPALEVQDTSKINQLIMNNTNTTERVQQALALAAGKDTGKMAVQYRALATLLGKKLQALFRARATLNHLHEEGEKAYYAADYPTALKKFQEGLQHAYTLGDKYYISEALTSIGIVYDDLGEYQKAIMHYQQALEIHRKIEYWRGIGSDLSNIGVIYHRIGQDNKALEYFQQSLDIWRKIDAEADKIADISNIGVIYSKLGQNKKALEYLQQVLETYQKIGDQRGEAGALTNLGTVYNDLGQYQQALQYLLQAFFYSPRNW